MPISKLYHTWKQKIEQLHPEERLSRVKLLAWLLAGLYTSRSVQLGRIASKIPGRAKRLSVVRRLERLMDNPHLRVRDWYEPVLRAILQARSGQLYRLIVDGTKVGPWHQLLLVSLAYRHRTLPLTWMWVRTPKNRGRSSAARQIALLSYLHRLLPSDAAVLLVGDQEFGAIDVLQQLDAWGWQYVLRQKGSEGFRPDKHTAWRSLVEVLHQAGEAVWLGPMEFTRWKPYRTNLLVDWALGEKEPWYLATNLPKLSAALKAYRYRVWIEATFADLKDNGFDLESTRLHTVQHLQRLTLAVMLLYLDLVANGARVIKNGQRPVVDHLKRRDLSIFRIGLYFRERRLANDLPFTIRLLPLIC